MLGYAFYHDACGEVCVSDSFVDYDYDIHKITPTATDLLFLHLFLLFFCSLLILWVFYFSLSFFLYICIWAPNFNGVFFLKHQHINFTLLQFFQCLIHSIHCNLVSFFFSEKKTWSKRHSNLIWMNLSMWPIEYYFTAIMIWIAMMTCWFLLTEIYFLTMFPFSIIHNFFSAFIYGLCFNIYSGWRYNLLFFLLIQFHHIKHTWIFLHMHYEKNALFISK